MKRGIKALILLALLGSMILFASAFWARRLALVAIENEQSRGLFCKWSMPTDGKVWPYTTGWAVNLPGPRLIELGVDYDIGNPVELGQAVRQLGGVTKLSIGQGKPDAVAAFLASLGPESSLRELYVFNVRLRNEASHILTNFKSLHDLAIVPSLITGESMPILPELVTLDLNASPVTDAGLNRLAALPKLESITVSGQGITAEGIRDLSILTGALKELIITDSVIAASSITGLKEHMSRQRSSFVLDITD